MHTEPGSIKTQNKQIIMPDLEEFEFKAIGEGLGFHQKEEKPKWNKPATNFKTSNQQVNTRSSTRQLNDSSISREQLGFLYQSQDNNAGIQKEKVVVKNKLVKEKLAGMPERFTAQLIDTALITSAVAVMIISMLALAGVPLNESASILMSFDIAPVVIILWSFSYIAYFTILETRQTPGKSIMRLKVVSMSGQQLGLSKSLERTVFRSLSWLALGFPLLMNFHGRLSGSKVIKQ